jgi:hypothetical protein
MQTLAEIKEKLKVFSRPDFVFDEIPHKYYLREKLMPSSTSIPHRFVKPVDWAHWHKVKGEEFGMEPEEVKAMWQANTDAACLLGGNIHKFIENHISGIPDSVDNYSPEEQVMIQNFLAFYETRMKDLIPVAQELRMFSEAMWVAGTLDNLSWKPDAEGEGGKLFILDYKTNAKWEDDSNKKYSRMLNVFGTEYDNKANHYSIQLSIYKIMLEEAGITVDDLLVIYIPREDVPRLIRCRDYTPQLKKYFSL